MGIAARRKQLLPDQRPTRETAQNFADGADPLRTALNRITPKGGASIVDEELAGALKQIGL